MRVLIVYTDGHLQCVRVRSVEDGHAMVRSCERLGYRASLILTNG